MCTLHTHSLYTILGLDTKFQETSSKNLNLYGLAWEYKMVSEVAEVLGTKVLSK